MHQLCLLMHYKISTEQKIWSGPVTHFYFWKSIVRWVSRRPKNKNLILWSLGSRVDLWSCDSTPLDLESRVRQQCLRFTGVYGVVMVVLLRFPVELCAVKNRFCGRVGRSHGPRHRCPGETGSYKFGKQNNPDSSLSSFVCPFACTRNYSVLQSVGTAH